MTGDYSPSLHFVQREGYIPLGTKVYLTNHEVTGWIVAYQSVVGLYYYISTTSDHYVSEESHYTAPPWVIEVLE